MTILIIAEHDHKSLKTSTPPAITAATKLGGGDIHVLIAGHNAGDAATDAASYDGVAKVLHADSAVYEHPLAESLTELMVKLSESYDTLIAPASFFGKNVMPRVAAKLDIQQISDITDIVDSKTFVRPIYAGNAFATVQTSQDKNVITVRPTAFDKPEKSSSAASIETIEAAGGSDKTSFVGQELTKSERPELASADIVISGGRGFGSAENFNSYLEPVADKLGAAIGASRAAVDAGYVPNDYQVGQTGKIVAPKLYIAVGISGAIQHLAGMKDSKVIVAINKDEEAPIFQVADYGLVGDLFEAMDELKEKL